eukprot:1136048-Pleurochrysis_carterae.AAC.2
MLQFAPERPWCTQETRRLQCTPYSSLYQEDCVAYQQSCGTTSNTPPQRSGNRAIRGNEKLVLSARPAASTGYEAGACAHAGLSAVA